MLPLADLLAFLDRLDEPLDLSIRVRGRVITLKVIESGTVGFVPNPFQRGILEALKGKALRTEPLGDAVKDRRRLFKHPGGLKELREQGLVDHHNRIGYFRPDAPPPALVEAEEPA